MTCGRGRAIQAFEDHLARGKGASVVNVASAAGLTSTGTGAVYAMTKAAMVSSWREQAIYRDCRTASHVQLPGAADQELGVRVGEARGARELRRAVDDHHADARRRQPGRPRRA